MTSGIATTCTRILLMMIVLVPSLSVSNSDIEEEPWRQAQLNEAFMRSLSKHQCVLKTIRTLKDKCRDNQCVLMMSGVMGDCVEWGSGDMRALCADYDKKYIARYCGSGYLSMEGCKLLSVHKEVACDRRGFTPAQQ